MTGRHRMTVIAAVATVLATAPLGVIYARWTWLFHCLVVVVAAVVAAIAARMLRAPTWTRPLVMVLALVTALAWLFPSGEEILAVVPSPGTVTHFAALISDAPTAMRTHSLPAPDHEALLFVTALGVGLVAVVVDFCVVVMRRPAMAGLPMLAVYSVPVAVRSSAVPPLPFVIGAVGYLWLLGADSMDRVRRFGRRFTGDGHDVDAWEPSPLAAAGRRLTVVGVVLAVVLPLGMPGLSGLVGRDPSGFGSGYGLGIATGEVNLFAELSGRLNQDVTVEMLRITTTEPDPFYLRFAVATEITDTGFAPTPPHGAPVSDLPTFATPDYDPGLARRWFGAPSSPQYSATVEVTEAYNMPMLPTYSRLARVSGLDNEWLYDFDKEIVFSRRARAAGLTYQFDYVRPDFSPTELRSAPPLPADHPLRSFTEVPEIPEVTRLVERLTENATTSYDKVLALFRYFSVRNGFRYSLETGPETTGVAIVDFLENKVGFCVQYAAALAWMARTAGIPARVAFGFTRGSDRDGSTVTLTNRNLHAWTEVYFLGIGWVPFDATPAASVRGAATTDWATHPDTEDADSTGSATAPAGPSGAPDPAAGLDEPATGGDGRAGASAADASPARGPWFVAVGVVLLLALLSAPAVSRAATRRRRLAPRTGSDLRQHAHDAWDELLDTLVDCRWAWDRTETPRATAARLITTGQLTGAAAEAVRLVALAEERARYARHPLHSDGVAEAVRTISRALLARVDWRVRWRARLAPPSVAARWRAALGGVVATARDRVGKITSRLPRRSPRALARRLLRG